MSLGKNRAVWNFIHSFIPRSRGIRISPVKLWIIVHRHLRTYYNFQTRVNTGAINNWWISTVNQWLTIITDYMRSLHCSISYKIIWQLKYLKFGNIWWLIEPCNRYLFIILILTAAWFFPSVLLPNLKYKHNVLIHDINKLNIFPKE